MTALPIKTNLIKPQPFVKWVGGKRGLLSQIIPLIPKEFNIGKLISWSNVINWQKL